MNTTRSRFFSTGVRRLAALALLVPLAASAQTGSGGDIRKVNGSVSVESAQAVGNVRTVNGGIQIGARATARAVETVNGGIRLSEGAQAESLESVNGGIRLAEDVRIGGDLKSVNGAITLAAGASVEGDLENVNGTITLERARIGGQVATTNGPILIGEGSVVEGGLLVRKPRGRSSDHRLPRVVIGPNAEVRGPLRFEREVLLYAHDSARLGEVTGVSVQRFSGDQPPR